MLFIHELWVLLLWKLDLDEEYFRIYDSEKLIAGYFDPDYGDIHPKKNSAEIISQMLKNRDKIIGGFIMVPMVKFGLFDTDLETDIGTVEVQVTSVLDRLGKWREFLSQYGLKIHFVRISHTDQDMFNNHISNKIFKTNSVRQKRTVY